MDSPQQPSSPLRRKSAMQFPIPGPNAFAQRAAKARRDSKPLPASPMTPDIVVGKSPEFDGFSACSPTGNAFWQTSSKPSQSDEKSSNDQRRVESPLMDSAGNEVKQTPKRQSSPRNKPSPRVTSGSSSRSGRVAFEGKNNEKLRQLIEGNGHVRTPSSSTRVANITKGKGRTPPPPLNLTQSNKTGSGKTKTKNFFTSNFQSPKKNFFEKLGLSNYRASPEPKKSDRYVSYSDRSPGLPLKAAQLLGTQSLNSRHEPPQPIPIASSTMIKFGELDLAADPTPEEIDAAVRKIHNDLPDTPAGRRLAREGSEPRLLALNQRIASGAAVGESKKNSPHTPNVQYFDHSTPPTPPSKSDDRDERRIPALKEGQPHNEASLRFGEGAHQGPGNIVEANHDDINSVHAAVRESTDNSGTPHTGSAPKYTPSLYQSSGLSPNPDVQDPKLFPAPLATFPANLRAQYPSMVPEQEPVKSTNSTSLPFKATSAGHEPLPTHPEEAMEGDAARANAQSQNYEEILSEYMARSFPQTYNANGTAATSHPNTELQPFNAHGAGVPRPHTPSASNNTNGPSSLRNTSASGSTGLPSISVSFFDARLTQIHDAVCGVPHALRHDFQERLVEHLTPLYVLMDQLHRQALHHTLETTRLRGEIAQLQHQLHQVQQAQHQQKSPRKQQNRGVKHATSVERDLNNWPVARQNSNNNTHTRAAPSYDQHRHQQQQQPQPVGSRQISPSHSSSGTTGPPSSTLDSAAGNNNLATNTGIPTNWPAPLQLQQQQQQHPGYPSSTFLNSYQASPPGSGATQQQEQRSSVSSSLSQGAAPAYHYRAGQQPNSADGTVYPPVKPGSSSAPATRRNVLSGDSDGGFFVGHGQGRQGGFSAQRETYPQRDGRVQLGQQQQQNQQGKGGWNGPVGQGQGQQSQPQPHLQQAGQGVRLGAPRNMGFEDGAIPHGGTGSGRGNSGAVGHGDGNMNGARDQSGGGGNSAWGARAGVFPSSAGTAAGVGLGIRNAKGQSDGVKWDGIAAGGGVGGYGRGHGRFGTQ